MPTEVKITGPNGFITFVDVNDNAVPDEADTINNQHFTIDILKQKLKEIGVDFKEWQEVRAPSLHQCLISLQQAKKLMKPEAVFQVDENDLPSIKLYLRHGEYFLEEARFSAQWAGIDGKEEMEKIKGALRGIARSMVLALIPFDDKKREEALDWLDWSPPRRHFKKYEFDHDRLWWPAE